MYKTVPTFSSLKMVNSPTFTFREAFVKAHVSVSRANSEIRGKEVAGTSYRGGEKAISLSLPVRLARRLRSRSRSLRVNPPNKSPLTDC